MRKIRNESASLKKSSKLVSNLLLFFNSCFSTVELKPLWKQYIDLDLRESSKKPVKITLRRIFLEPRNDFLKETYENK